MKQNVNEKSYIRQLTFFSFILLIVLVPLLFISHSANPFVFSKNDSLIILGSIFIILSYFLLYFNNKHRNKDVRGLYIDKGIDPYVILFFMAAVLSSIFSVNIYISYYGYYTRPLGLEIYLYIFLIYLFSSSVIADAKSMKQVMRVMELCAVVISVYAILQYTENDPLNIILADAKRPAGTLGNGVFLGGFLLLVFPFTLMGIVQKKKLDISVLFLLLILSAVVVSQTRTAYAGMLVEVVAVILFYSIVKSTYKPGLYKKLRYSIFIIGGIVVVLSLLLLFARNNVFIKRFIDITALFQNPRWLLWGESMKVFAKYPITGCGLCTFPAVFETVYSMSFKINDVRNYYDNAHSNFVHTLCSMGIIGISAYMVLLGHTIYILIRSIFSVSLKPGQKTIYIAFFAMLCGYIVYGVADFDEVSIMFYFFIYLSLLKSQMRMDNISHAIKLSSKLKVFLHKTVYAVFTFVILFICFNAYVSLRQFTADKNFLAASSLVSQRKMQASFDYYATAVGLWEGNAFFHYEYGGVLLDYAVSNLALDDKMKNALLEKARSEFLTALNNYPFRSTCLGLISIVNYELGDTAEAEKIKNELLGRDSLLVNYRYALANLYIQKKDYDKAMQHILFACKYDPGDSRLLRTITVLLNDRNCPDPMGYCHRILAVDPNNEAANYFLRNKK